eukprot:4579413-Prymnesium_polylepis.1
MRTNAPYHGLTFGKLNGQLRLAAQPPQIVRFASAYPYVSNHQRRARSRQSAGTNHVMRSEIARQNRPKAAPFGPLTFTAGCPRVPQHAGPTRE